MAIETLQSLLEAKAEKELKQEIETAFNNLYKYRHQGVIVDLGIIDQKIRFDLLVDNMKEAVFKSLIAKAKENAVKNFIKEVETFREDLNYLQSEVENAQR